MENVAILAISHGHYAREAVASAEMIVGKQENVQTISVTEDKDLERVLNEVNAVYEELETSQGLLVLVDILGGTPSNVAGNLILSKENVHGITGFNLPLLLELFLNRAQPMTELVRALQNTHTESFHHLNELLVQGGGEDEY